MARDDRKYNGENKPHSEPIIEDLRHSRDLSGATSEPPAAVEPPPPPKPAEAKPAAPPPEPSPAAHVEPPDDLPPDEALEMDQIRQIFGAGVVSYLRSQLGMLINFAVIYLGRAANPATGLVGADLPKAKLTIDLLEAITSSIQVEMSTAERTELRGILDELKRTFLQVAASAPKAPTPPGEA